MRRVNAELMIPLRDERTYANVLTSDAQVTEEGRVLALDREGAWRDIGYVHESFLPVLMTRPDREPWTR